MSTWCCLHRIAEDHLQLLLQSPDDLGALVEQAEEESLTIKNSWHAIHFLLTGKADGDATPLDFFYLGGTYVEEVEVRYLTARQTYQFAEAVKQLRVEDLPKKVDTAEMAQADLFPGYWDEVTNEEAVDYIAEHLLALQDFLEVTITEGKALVQSYV